MPSYNVYDIKMNKRTIEKNKTKKVVIIMRFAC